MNCDTDSVKYIQPSGETPLIETGDKFRDMTTELRSSERITEFLSGDSNNYDYRMLNTEVGREKAACKFRGIILNYNASKMLNFCHLGQDSGG